MLRSQKYTTLICTANVFCSVCTTIHVGLCHNIQCCSLCLAAQVHTHVPLLEAVHYTQTDIAFLSEIQRAPCWRFQRTHTTPPSVFLWKASVLNALLLIVLAGMQMDLAYPLKCHSQSNFLHANGYSIRETEPPRNFCGSSCRHTTYG
jgi:hypothetical protein